jgi:hypothetical protein
MVLVPSGTYVLGPAGALLVTTGMQIVGAGASSTIIDAHGASGILSIAASAGAVAISGVTFTHGKGSSGSAIADLAGQLTLSEDVFALDTTGGEGAGGAGAVRVGGTGSKALTVANSTFADNAAGGEGTKNVSSGQGSGGGIAFAATGTLTVTNSTFSGNTAGGNGGEGISSGQGGGGAIDIFGNAVVNVTSSSFIANRAGGNGGVGTSSAQAGGGAIEFFGETAAATLTVAGSTFTSNQAGGSAGAGAASGQGAGGAISTGGEGSVTLSNDTLEGNSVGGPIGATSGAGAVGGGLSMGIAATLLNDTIDGNAVIGAGGAGGNINASPGTVTLKNTILSAGVAAIGPNCAGTFSSKGHNIESTTPSQCGLTAALGDLIGTNPLLGSLQFNGGPTQTQALLAGSPAINAGDNSGCPATDQRGVQHERRDRHRDGDRECRRCERLLPNRTEHRIRPSDRATTRRRCGGNAGVSEPLGTESAYHLPLPSSRQRCGRHHGGQRPDVYDQCRPIGWQIIESPHREPHRTRRDLLDIRGRRIPHAAEWANCCQATPQRHGLLVST